MQLFFCHRVIATTFDSKALLSYAKGKNRFHIDSLRIHTQTSTGSFFLQETISTQTGVTHNQKSVMLGLTMSAIIPGTGQLYANKGNESLIKGVSFLAFEATGLILYVYNQNKGKRIEKKYEKYADQHWDVNKYLDYLEKSLNLPEAYLGRGDQIHKDLLEQAENSWGQLTNVSVHHLYKNTRQQYYEMIYKYPEQFALGWSDAVNDPGTYPFTGYTRNSLTPVMTDYRSMRIKSNNYLSTARGMTGVIMINHVLSLVDAAWTVKRKNREETGKLSLSLRLEQKQYYSQWMTMPTLRITY